MSIGWFGKSLIAAVLFVVPFISVGFFSRNFSLKPEVILVWYGIGLAFGCFSGTIVFKIVKLSELSPTIPLVMVAMVGIFFSAIPNILLYQSLAVAPNPGLPMAVINISAILTFFVTIALANFLPKWFVAAKFDWVHIAGIILIILGASLISLKG
jgi:hypothetical protein